MNDPYYRAKTMREIIEEEEKEDREKAEKAAEKAEAKQAKIEQAPTIKPKTKVIKIRNERRKKLKQMFAKKEEPKKIELTKKEQMREKLKKLLGEAQHSVEENSS
jgi:hypothetical protein